MALAGCQTVADITEDKVIATDLTRHITMPPDSLQISTYQRLRTASSHYHSKL